MLLLLKKAKQQAQSALGSVTSRLQGGKKTRKYKGGIGCGCKDLQMGGKRRKTLKKMKKSRKYKKNKKSNKMHKKKSMKSHKRKSHKRKSHKKKSHKKK